MTDELANRFAWIVFVDLIDSSAFADVLGVEDYYDKLLRPFHNVAANVFRELQNGYDELNLPKLMEHNSYQSIRGDEVIGVFAADNNAHHGIWEERRKLAWLALRLGLRLKASWLLSPYNAERVRGQRAPVDVAVGIHCGHLVWRQERDWKTDNVTAIVSPEGFALSYCKRIESAARQCGDGRFALSPEARLEAVRHGISDQFFRRQEVGVLKGLTGSAHVWSFADIRLSDEYVQAFESLPAKGSTFMTLLANVIDSYPQPTPPKYEQPPVRVGPPPTEESDVNPAFRSIVFDRLPLLTSFPNTRVVKTPWEYTGGPNRYPAGMIRDQIFSAPEAMRAAATLEAFYSIDRDWHDGFLTAPFDWYMQAKGEGLGRYWAAELRALISASFIGKTNLEARVHYLRPSGDAVLEPYQAARIALALGTKEVAAPKILGWHAQVSQFHGRGDVLADAAVTIAELTLKARIANPDAVVDSKDLKAENLRTAYEEDDLDRLNRVGHLKDHLAEEEQMWRHFSRPRPAVLALLARIFEVIGNRPYAKVMLERAVGEFEAERIAQRDIVLSFPSFKYEAKDFANYERPNGWHHCPIVDRRELDWWSGEVKPMPELVSSWQARIALLTDPVS